MKRTIKLLHEPSTEQFYVYYESPGKILFFKVDQINPTMLTRVFENAMFLSSHERGKVIEEMENFAKEEIKKLYDHY
jgi:hypothetical protein